MLNTSAGTKQYKLSKSTTIAFLLTLVMCSCIIIITIINRSDVEKLQMEQVIMEKSVKIGEVISKLLYKTETLSALVIQGNITPESFASVATTIVDDPAILNVLIAPDGIVNAVYPPEGNEAVIGLNFLEEGAGNAEAKLAMETGNLVFGGPFTLVQGGEALVGRMPVYIDNEIGDKIFWGIVSVTLKYPQALDGVGLNILETQGFSYEIWRYSPDTGQRQVIASSTLGYNEKARFIEKEISILNANWYFRVAPVRMWYQYSETWLLIFAGLCISMLVAFVTQNNYELRLMKTEIEHIARTDPMTGVFNRRYFMDTAPARIERARRQHSESYVIVFDIDHFKNINDRYGHAAGDRVLIEIAALAENSIRPYDLLARFGGEEFVILASPINSAEVLNLAERLRKAIANLVVPYNGTDIHVSASFGIAPTGTSSDDALVNADMAMYQAKSEGRNRIKMFEL